MKIYFHKDEFLCSSLSFFGNEASILYFGNNLFRMVKIVSALLSMFTYKSEYAYFKTPYTPKKLTYGSFGRDIRLFFALAANLVVRAIS